jgi:hypothetical protein
MKKLIAFMLGMREFRCAFTTNCIESEAYDCGRELAHRFTFRQFESA